MQTRANSEQLTTSTRESSHRVQVKGISRSRSEWKSSFKVYGRASSSERLVSTVASKAAAPLGDRRWLLPLS